MLIKLGLLALTSAITFTLSKPIPHAYARAWLSVAVSVLLTLPSLIDARFAILVPVVGAAVAVACRSKWAGIPAVMGFVLSLLIALTPRGADVALLELKYSDNFNYLSDNTFYSSRLGQGITFVRAYGDDYQAKLYEEAIVRYVQSLFPDGTRFGRIQVTPVQTTDLFDGWDTYFFLVAPEITVYADIPETYWRPNTLIFPPNITVEGLL